MRRVFQPLQLNPTRGGSAQNGEMKMPYKQGKETDTRDTSRGMTPDKAKRRGKRRK